MVTARIQIKPHLCEYVAGKYNNFSASHIRFPDNLDLYHAIANLTQKRPRENPVDRGNMEIILPTRYAYKNPETYNYLGVRSQKIIEKKSNFCSGPICANL